MIPADIRRALGLREGEPVVAWVEDGRLVIQPRRSVEEELWSMFEGVERSLAEELIRERREEAVERRRECSSSHGWPPRTEVLRDRGKRDGEVYP